MRASRPLHGVDVDALGLTRLFAERSFPAGAPLFGRGTPRVAIVVAGFVHYRSRSAEFDLHELLGPGDFVGLDRLLGRATGVSATSAGPSRLLVADLALVKLALGGDPAFAAGVVALVLERVHDTRRLLARDVGGTQPVRHLTAAASAKGL